MEIIEKVSTTAKGKLSLLNKSKGKYIVSSILAGMFVGFAVILMATLGGTLNEAGSPYSKLIMGLSFGVALSLVLMAGADLFTGNNLVMTIGFLNKEIKAIDVLRVWIFSYIGNLIGSIMLALIYVGTGLATGTTGKFFQTASAAKMNAPFGQLFFKRYFMQYISLYCCMVQHKAKRRISKAYHDILVYICFYKFKL